MRPPGGCPGRWLGAFVLLFLCAGCGYSFAGDRLGLPPDVHSVSVGTIENRSHEYGVEKTLAFALEREIHIRGQLRMEEEPAGGDAVLTGAIREMRVRPVAFNGNDQAVEYEIALTLDLTLTRHSDGHVLWRVRKLRETDEYATSGAVVVTSSSQFQQGTLDAPNLNNPQFSTSTAPPMVSLQLAETERRLAITRLVKQAAHDLYDQMVENF